MEENIDAYLRREFQPTIARGAANPPGAPRFTAEGTEDCFVKPVVLTAHRCDPPGNLRYSIYSNKNGSGRLVFTNE
jgi:hypothetical protein